MVRVEGGTYIMGQPDPDLGGEGWSSDECSHTVQVAPFSIGVTEVTQAQWKSVMGSKDTPTEFDGEDLPVERVSWSEALTFIKKLNQLLPAKQKRWVQACTRLSKYA